MSHFKPMVTKEKLIPSIARYRNDQIVNLIKQQICNAFAPPTWEKPACAYSDLYRLYDKGKELGYDVRWEGDDLLINATPEQLFSLAVKE